MNYVSVNHPYGAKPLGNAFLATDELRNVKTKGLGALRVLPDEALLEILFFLTAKDLVCVLKCSRILYVYCHYNDLWRDLTLFEWDKSCITVDLKFSYTWKDSYMLLHCNKHNNVDALLSSDHYPHVPIGVKGVYSNALYKSWACHAYDITACPGFMIDDIEHLSSRDISVKQFIDRYEIPNKPLIIKDAIQDWQALSKWTRDYLVEACGDKKFRATSATAPLAAAFTMKEYFNYASQVKEESPLYLFERDFESKTSLGNDYSIPTYFSPSSVGNCTDLGTDLFHVFGEHRPDYHWFIIGPPKSGSIFHIDPNQTNAWNASIEGRKKWIFYPPGVTPPGVMCSADLGDVTVPLSTGEWLTTFWKFHLEARKHPDVSKRPIETILHPGEVIFVPHGYWHMVINIDACIALTYNYVSTSNLADCLRFLRDKVDQISGVRDRFEAVQPDQMYESFCTKLVDEGVLSQACVTSAIEHSQETISNESCGMHKNNRLIKKRKIELKDTATTIKNEDVTATIDGNERSNDCFTFSFF